MGRGTPPRRLSRAVTSPTNTYSAAAAAAAARRRPPPAVQPTAPAASVSSARRSSVLEVLARVSCPSPPWPRAPSSSAATSSPAPPVVLAWVPCVVEVRGEGDDAGFMQVRQLGGPDAAHARVEVVGAERLRTVAATPPSADAAGSAIRQPLGLGDDVEVRVASDAAAGGSFAYSWFLGVCMRVDSPATAGAVDATATVRLMVVGGNAGEVTDAAHIEVGAPAGGLRRVGDAGFADRDDDDVSALIRVLVDDEVLQMFDDDGGGN
ncbi:hypothetical protein HK405_011650 [Cladochytrium tenue]|nr:hypothetical protein HK405_011650 [Cladochytrium tenue]